MIHHAPLGKENVRVSIKIELKSNAPIPFPVDEDMTLVEDVVNVVVAWPKAFVIMPNESREQCEEMVTSNPFEQFYDHASDVLVQTGTDSKTLKFNADVFGTQNEVAFDLRLEVVESICKRTNLSTGCMAFYVRYLHEKAVACGKQNKFGFANPNSICSLNPNVITYEILKRLQSASGKHEFLFIPYSHGVNWILLIVKMDKMKVSWVDPLRRKVQYNLDNIMKTAAKGLFLDGRRRTNATWGYPKAPKQSEYWESGYYVMIYMKEIIEGTTNLLTMEKAFKKSMYHQRGVDEVRHEWISFAKSFI